MYGIASIVLSFKNRIFRILLSDINESISVLLEYIALELTNFVELGQENDWLTSIEGQFLYRNGDPMSNVSDKLNPSKVQVSPM